ncbi:helix-turn-helix transcriptional regulator [Mangrovitalea sediminis]|uniref:helix-turn-helix transcriptional regulator n=1 Tax=Mangrovitalea sediminis TaxID=1982043 RepID=UPI000BE59FE7|nr:WYL domain-containing protein [Mangrovitalea sediminis]
MNRTERFYKIHQQLSSGRPISMKRLQETVGVSRTTVMDDFAYLRDFLGAPIIYSRESGGYFYDPEQTRFELPGFWLNADELQALLITEQWLDGIQPGLLSDMIGPLRQRVQSLLDKSGHDSTEVNRRIRTKAVHTRQVDNQDFQRLCGALLQRLTIDAEYHGRASDSLQERRLHPQRLLQYRDNWYLLAWCELKQAMRLFATERLRFRVLDTPCIDRPDSELDHIIQSGFGIFAGAAQNVAQLRFLQPNARWVADEHWHPDQRGEWDGDTYLLNIPYNESTELEMEILRHCPFVEVMGPVELKQKIKERLQLALGKFE